MLKMSLNAHGWSMQLSDISQWGSAADTAQLIIPQGSKVFSSGVMQIELPARDTRSIMGMVKPPPQNIYRCISLT